MLETITQLLNYQVQIEVKTILIMVLGVIFYLFIKRI